MKEAVLSKGIRHHLLSGLSEVKITLDSPDRLWMSDTLLGQPLIYSVIKIRLFLIVW